jgi:hypothetical protein
MSCSVRYGEFPKNLRMRHTTGEVFQHVIRSDAQPADAWLSALPGSIVMISEYVMSLTLFENPAPGNWKVPANLV